MQNLSFVLEGIHKVKFEDRPVPELKNPHDVIINVKYTGICGSDVCTMLENKYEPLETD
jgi:D-xylulose reductase